MAERVINMFEDEKRKIYMKIGLAIAVVFFIIFLNPCVQVDAGHKGVVLNMGAVSETILDEGIHIRIPIIQKVKMMEQKKELRDLTSRCLEQTIRADKLGKKLIGQMCCM